MQRTFVTQLIYLTTFYCLSACVFLELFIIEAGSVELYVLPSHCHIYL